MDPLVRCSTCGQELGRLKHIEVGPNECLEEVNPTDPEITLPMVAYPNHQALIEEAADKHGARWWTWVIPSKWDAKKRLHVRDEENAYIEIYRGSPASWTTPRSGETSPPETPERTLAFPGEGKVGWRTRWDWHAVGHVPTSNQIPGTEHGPRKTYRPPLAYGR